MDTYRWITRPFSWDLAETIAAELDVPLLVGVVLARRGFTSVEEARSFLTVDPVVPDPFLFSDMQSAVELLADAVRRSRRVVVHGDYDVDGISATVLMVEGLRELGLDPEPYMPSRFVEGYGLSQQAVEEISRGGDGLLVTVDCGVNYPDEVAFARSRGLDVLVTDHHRPGDVLPDAPIIHPVRGTYPGDHLCGVGLALKTLHALHAHLRGVTRTLLPEALERQLDLVALGTIADLVPLRGENRYYVKEGLLRLSRGDRLGLRALAAVAGVEGEVDTYAVGFRLSPRLNAAGRLRDPQAPLRLLLTDDPDEAQRLAAELDDLNRQRQEVEAGILAEAVAQVEALPELPTALVLTGEGWHEGVVGIVASRVVDRYHRPAVLLAEREGVAKGSGRSIASYDIMSGLRSVDHLLTVYGGHAQAAGLTLPVPNVAQFRAALQAHAEAQLDGEALRRRFSPDAIVRGDELNLETADALGVLGPFGMGNPRVQLLALDARLERPERTRSGDHLRCTLVVDDVRTRGIGFGLADKLPALHEADYCAHAGFRLEPSEWQGYTRVEAHLHSLYRPNGNGEAALGCSPYCPYLDPLDAPPPCSRCSEPLGRPPGPVALSGRDLRDRPGRLSAIAQVVSSGEQCVVIGSSVTQTLRALAAGLPLQQLGVTGAACVSRLCWRTRMPEVGEGDLLFVDWQAAVRRGGLLVDRRHVVVTDPPYDAVHAALLDQLASAGARIHLCYGAEQRAATADLLRFRVHPRIWMVALYRAWREGLRGDEAYGAVAERVWVEHEQMPAVDELSQAEAILAEIGIDAASTGTATMKAESSPTYQGAVRAYSEALELCRTL